MAIIYSNTVKNTRMQAVVTAIGNGGSLVIGTSTLNAATGVLATIPLSDPSFTVANGVMTMGDIPLTTTATGTGVAAKAELRSAAGTVIASGLNGGHGRYNQCHCC